MKDIAVIQGGFSRERDISLASGAVVTRYLALAGYRCHDVRIDREGWFLQVPDGPPVEVNRHDFSVALPEGRLRFDCVFNAVHGTPGEDGFIAAYLELLGIPHTSCNAYAAALTFNKRDLLAVLAAQGVPCARSVRLDAGDSVDPEAIVDVVGLPCFVKANRAGSSFGISKVERSEDLPRAVDHALAEDNEVLIEAALVGTEVSVGAFRRQGEVIVLPLTEIVSHNAYFDYAAKYEGASEEITPARIDEVEAERVRSWTRRIYTSLKLDGFSRSEFILVEGIPHLLEVNTTPGLTEASILPQQAIAAGIDLETLFSGAVEEAMVRWPPSDDDPV